VRITDSGPVPKEVVIATGGRVTFVNDDQRVHDMLSDPEFEHTDCPAINLVGFLTPGQRRETGALETPRTCGYHDHTLHGIDTFKGTIVIR
jgi:hypothetical protein